MGPAAITPENPPPPTVIPRVYRAMKRDQNDGLPIVGPSSTELGVRSGTDITVDPVTGDVVLDGNGMSVAPGLRVLPFTRIPKRLRHIVPGATGSNSASCYALGVGPFQPAAVANGLELIPDQGQNPIHGVIAPAQVVPLALYETDLANTRGMWQVDEN